MAAFIALILIYCGMLLALRYGQVIASILTGSKEELHECDNICTGEPPPYVPPPYNQQMHWRGLDVKKERDYKE